MSSAFCAQSHHRPAVCGDPSGAEGSSESLEYPPPHRDANRNAGGLRASPKGPRYYQHEEHDRTKSAAATGAGDGHGVGEDAGAGAGWALEGAPARDPSWGVEGGGAGEVAAVREEEEELAAAFATGTTSFHVPTLTQPRHLSAPPAPLALLLLPAYMLVTACPQRARARN